jgi:hypothetical protein
MTNTTTARAAGSILVVALTVGACGGAAESSPPQAPTPSSPADVSKDLAPSETPRTIEEAESQIARARSMLEGPPKAAAPEANRPSEAPAPPPKPLRESPAKRDERGEDLCHDPCRALDSMRRAVEALCRMTGDADNRCLDARKTLTDSTTRLSTCRCETH